MTVHPFFRPNTDTVLSIESMRNNAELAHQSDRARPKECVLYCTLDSALYSVHWTVHCTVHWTVHSEEYMLDKGQYTVNSIQCSVNKGKYAVNIK